MTTPTSASIMKLAAMWISSAAANFMINRPEGAR